MNTEVDRDCFETKQAPKPTNVTTTSEDGKWPVS